MENQNQEKSKPAHNIRSYCMPPIVVNIGICTIYWHLARRQNHINQSGTHHSAARYLQGEKRETVEHKLKILKRELEHIIRKLTDWKDFVFADPLLPFGTIREANTHCTHLQIAQANPRPKFAKECNLAPAILIIQNSGSWRKIS